MNAARLPVRELAGWGLDEDAYRPATYSGDPDSASALVAARPMFAADNALLHLDDDALRNRLAAEEARTDLQAEMRGLEWFAGVVDLRCLLAFQRRIVLNPAASQPAIPEADDWNSLVDLCFGRPKPVVFDVIRNEDSLLFRSDHPNLHFRFTGDSSSPIAIHSGSPFFEVAQYRGRWFLRDGYHRAYRCLQAGVFRLPAVLLRARTMEELGAVHPWFFPEEVLFSATPPRVIDFLDDALVIRYNRSPLVKTLRIAVEESYTLQGEAL